MERSKNYIPYKKQRLVIPNQPSLELRRLRTDLIFHYKILHDLIDTNLKVLFAMASDVSTCSLSLRDHAYKLLMPNPLTDLLKFSCAYRVVINWKSLPSEVSAANTLSLFKQRLTNFSYCTD